MPTPASDRRKRTFRQGGGKGDDEWPDENDATQRVVPERGGGVVQDVSASTLGHISQTASMEPTEGCKGSDFGRPASLGRQGGQEAQPVSKEK